MSNSRFPRVLMVGTACLLLTAPIPSMADVLAKTFTCPRTEATFFPPGKKIEINDLVLSSTAAMVVTVKFNPPNQRVVKLAMGANDTVAVNFTGIVESAEEQAIRIDCEGEGTLFVTIVGNAAF